jgi:hypothetical protein
MVVILPDDRYDEWLRADARHSAGFLNPYPADGLKAEVPPPRIEPLSE